MEAIIRDGGRQFMVKEGLTIQVDFREADTGSAVEFGEVLYVNDDSGARVGRPLVEGARVVGKVLGQERGKKVMVTQFRRRKDSRRRNGHRQPYTSVQIQKIQG